MRSVRRVTLAADGDRLLGELSAAFDQSKDVLHHAALECRTFQPFGSLCVELREQAVRPAFVALHPGSPGDDVYLPGPTADADKLVDTSPRHLPVFERHQGQRQRPDDDARVTSSPTRCK